MNKSIGCWYLNEESGTIYCVKNITTNMIECFLFNIDCIFCTHGQFGLRVEKYENDSLANENEIKYLLMNECFKRGFEKDVIFLDLDSNNKKIFNRKESFVFGYKNGNINSVKNGENGTIFKDGKWAEIIDEKTLEGQTFVVNGVEYELKIK